MALLNVEDRKALWAEFMSDASHNREVLALSKHELRDALDAVDQWIEDNRASYNQAIPQPARSALTAIQKVRLLFCVIRRRWEVS